jgi:hypothetical protein
VASGLYITPCNRPLFFEDATVRNSFADQRNVSGPAATLTFVQPASQQPPNSTAGRARCFPPAEITRLEQIADLTAGPLPVLFLLDELLQGANSHDRRADAEPVVRYLVGRGAIGLVTTHHLALAQIAESPGSGPANFHFEDRLENGKLHFIMI